MALVIPIDAKSKIACTIPVCVAFIILLEYCKEVFSICFADVLDAKIVDNEGKTNRLPFVLSDSWGDCTLHVACFE